MRKTYNILIVLLTIIFVFLFSGCNGNSSSDEIRQVKASFNNSESSFQEEQSSLDSVNESTSSSLLATSSSSQTGSVSESQTGGPPICSSSLSETFQNSDSNSGSSGYISLPLDEVRGVWLSYLDLAPMITGKTESQFTSNIDTAFSKISEMGFNTVYAQVRPFGDALYPSEYFPQSYLFTGTEGNVGSAPFDALKIMVIKAHSYGLKIEAWINPYRIRLNTNASTKPLSSSNPANNFIKSGSDAVLEYDGGIYYNPGSSEARSLIVNGIKEIVGKYDVDGIHFDDYFYPSGATADFDDTTYRASGTSMSLADWRREQVNILVKQVYKATGAGKQFGISPAGNNSNNFNLLYCDVSTWVSTPGYIDYLCPQIYFAFNNTVCPYKATVDLFNNLIKPSSNVKLYIGLAAYKIDDATYGSEWTTSTDMIKRQIEYARGVSNYCGFALFRYDNIVSSNSRVKSEMSNLKLILK